MIMLNAVAAAGILLAGCQLQDPAAAASESTPSMPAAEAHTAAAGVASEWRIVDADELSPRERAQLAHAEQSRGIMGQRLMGRVSEAVAAEGHAHAIDVCRIEADPIAMQVAEQRQIAIGRTSARLRNPDNQPPEWARAHVNSDAQTALVARGPDSTIGTLLPIFLAAPCMACHGPQEQLDASVTEALAQWYPDDQATGFGKGDLRGWFWVEAGPASVDDEQVRAIEALLSQAQSLAEISHGERLYRQACAACHGPDGAGAPGVFPPLLGTARVRADPAALIALSLDGMTGPVEVHGSHYDGFMPGQAQLGDADMAALLSFVRSAWGNDAAPVKPVSVGAIREHTHTRTRAWTAAELAALEAEFAGRL